MKHARSLAIILSAAVPAFVAAQTFEEELDAWEVLQEQNQMEAGMMDAEILFQSSPELFPQTDSDPETPSVREERTDAFVTVTVDGKEMVFTDVPRDTWYAPYVREIAEKGIVSGYRDGAGVPTGKFGPADNVTIGQMAKVMLLSSGHTEEECRGTPLNPTATDWSAGVVACAEDLEWSVYGDGSVDVARNATRAEVVTTLLQAFDVEPGQRTGTGFTDVTLATQYGAGIEQAQRDGIVSGYTDAAGVPKGLFGPEDPVTRAEFAKIVTLGLQIYADR